VLQVCTHTTKDHKETPLWKCHGSVTGVLRKCYGSVTEAVKGYQRVSVARYKGVTRVLQGCYHSVHGACSDDVTPGHETEPIQLRCEHIVTFCKISSCNGDLRCYVSVGFRMRTQLQIVLIKHRLRGVTRMLQ
jgi:hypothetical protein